MTTMVPIFHKGVTNIPQGPTLDRQQSQQFQQQSPQRQRDNAAAALISWSRLRAARPLIHCITNFVSMDIMANTLLAVGASPAMLMEPEEVVEFASLADVLLVNIGTRGSNTETATKLAAAEYRRLGKPWVLDPVAVGATKYRLQVVKDLLQLQPTLIRGNASEVMTVAGAVGAGGCGVDSTASSEAALESGKQLALQQHCLVAISGATDLITDGRRVIRCSEGIPEMQLITATGCSLTAVMAAFLATAPPDGDVLMTLAHAMAIYGASGGRQADGTAPSGDQRLPGSLRTAMIDSLASGRCCNQLQIVEDA